MADESKHEVRSTNFNSEPSLRKGSDIQRTFGEHIGDSKYDRWHTGEAMLLSDFEQMTDDQLFANLTKDNIFPKPDYEKLQAEGIDPVVLYYRKALRDSLPSNPKTGHYSLDPHGAYEKYFRLVSAARDECKKIKTVSDMAKSGINWMLEHKFVTNEGRSVMIWNPYASKRFVTLAMKSDNILFFCNERIKKGFLMTREEKILSHYTFPALNKTTMSIEHSSWGKESKMYLRYEPTHGMVRFLYPDKGIDMEKLQADLENETGYLVIQGHNLKAYGFKTLEMAEKWAIEQEDEPAKTVKRKKRYVPKELSHIDQTDHSMPILCMDKTGEDLMQTFGFRGGEFGEYESQKERQTNLNMCSVAFHNLACALGINDTDVSLGQNLAIAFGARGQGGAMAHFEPVKNVINLTKLKGAGSLSHEWIHALDHAIGVAIAEKTGRPSTAAMATDNRSLYLERYSDFPALGKLVEALEYKKNPDQDYFIHTDFYNNAVKMDATYQKEHGNYWSDPAELLARAGACYIKDKCEEMGIHDDYLSGHAEGDLTAPHGEERRLFNTYFDAMIEEVKERGILHDVDRDLEESKS